LVTSLLIACVKHPKLKEEKYGLKNPQRKKKSIPEFDKVLIMPHPFLHYILATGFDMDTPTTRYYLQHIPIEKIV
jgi:hypothetical protein